MARRRFFVDAVQSGRARIIGPDAHHLTRVLRVEPGQQFEISDNHSVYLAEVESARKDLVSFSIREKVPSAEPVVHTTLLASLIRFERFEWMLEKATELGVARIVPVRPSAAKEAWSGRRESALHDGTALFGKRANNRGGPGLPEIDAPVLLTSALETDAAYRYVLEEAEAPPMLPALPPQREPGASVALLVGPEGGWTDRERDQIAGGGWCAVSLGATILRAETAAIAALAIVNAAWGGQTRGARD